MARGIRDDLLALGYARLPSLVAPEACDDIARLWSNDRRFRSTVDMARYQFGEGQYRYFGEPLPRRVAALRRRLYGVLAPVATVLSERLGGTERFPPTLAAYRARCAQAGQCKPTPLLLRYDAGGYNRLHRDLYGGEVFPLQVVIGLGRPSQDYTGGEFLLVENHPRKQSVGHAIAIEKGEGVVFPVRERPALGARGVMRVEVRHGVSRVTSGVRFALGLIFHDAA